MKCELCKVNDAEAAITLVCEGKERELYVCNECAKKERLKRQRKSQRTRKLIGLPPGLEMSITQIGGDGESEPPPIIGEIMDAISSMVTGANCKLPDFEDDEPNSENDAYQTLDVESVSAELKVKGALHLEGLYLLGELDAIKQAMRALKLRLVGFELDGIADLGHVFRLEYTGSIERAKRVVCDLITQERAARARLLSTFPRVFGDALSRSLAILKNCRLLSQGELFDLLSPVRLAALNGLLNGITLEEVETLIENIDLTKLEETLPNPEQDATDAYMADQINRQFADVVLNARAEEKFQ